MKYEIRSTIIRKYETRNLVENKSYMIRKKATPSYTFNPSQYSDTGLISCAWASLLWSLVFFPEYVFRNSNSRAEHAERTTQTTVPCKLITKYITSVFLHCE